uniref:Uncharacterized protein n=1 Tax=Theropithecus gelada TaxID=9565 RepID=A0A8D2GBB3_THEGE
QPEEQQQGLQQLDWQQDDPQPEEQQQGLQQLDWEQPQEPHPPYSPRKSHSRPWSLHRSHSPPWSPRRSHSWSRNRLAHSSTRACSSTRAHSSWSHSPHSPHSRSHSPYSWSHSPHSWSHSLRSSHSSPWFWWIEGGAGRGAGEREVCRCGTPRARILYTPAQGQVRGWAHGHFLVPACATGPGILLCFAFL